MTPADRTGEKPAHFGKAFASPCGVPAGGFARRSRSRAGGRRGKVDRRRRLPRKLCRAFAGSTDYLSYIKYRYIPNIEVFHMTGTPHVPSEDAAQRAWRLMLDYVAATAPGRERSLQRRGLSANDSRALSSLDEDEGRPIGALASRWGCDPSNATFIIDRLEKAGLAKRRSSPADRRVKLVVLTRRGARTKAELADELNTPPPGFDRLSPADLEVLEYVLGKLVPRIEPGDAA
jgi:DNA-binding MarR family transcriptional regulator